MKRRLSLCFVLTGCFTLATSGLAQQPPAGKGQQQRLVQPVKYGNAKDLAELLTKHFKNADAQVLADPGSNSLLINAPPPIVKEIIDHLEQLDRRPRQVALEVIIAEITPRKGEDGKTPPFARELDVKELQGPAEVVLAKVAALKKKGVLTDVKHLHLKVVDHQLASVKDLVSRPYVVGVNTAGGFGKGGAGVPQRTLNYKSIGTLIEARVRIPDDKTVLVEFKLDDSRLHTPENGIVLGNDEELKPIRATENVSTTVSTRISLATGDASAIEGIKSESRSGQVQTLVIVAVRIVEGS